MSRVPSANSAGVVDPRIPHVLRCVQRALEPLQAQALGLADTVLNWTAKNSKYNEQITSLRSKPRREFEYCTASSAKQQSRERSCASPLPRSCGRAPPEVVARSAVLKCSGSKAETVPARRRCHNRTAARRLRSSHVALSSSARTQAMARDLAVVGAAFVALIRRRRWTSTVALPGGSYSGVATATIEAVQAFLDGN